LIGIVSRFGYIPKISEVSFSRFFYSHYKGFFFLTQKKLHLIFRYMQNSESGELNSIWILINFHATSCLLLLQVDIEQAGSSFDVSVIKS